MKIKNFIIIKLFFLCFISINSNFAKAGECETTISSATTSQLTCAGTLCTSDNHICIGDINLN